ncbi:MAG: GspE/PulE family protein [Eubacteriales bacterium]|nr:GspE/PulE family protein [Eubacteriales bacterium]
MNLDYEILLFFLYKKIIKKRDLDSILDECGKLDIPAEKYILSHNLCSETAALDALGEYYCMPYVQMDMLEVDKDLLKVFNLQFLRKNKFVPIYIDINGIMIVATGHPLDFAAMSIIAAFYTGAVNYILVPPSQIDKFIDGETAIRSTAVALEDLNNSSERKAGEQGAEKAEDISDDERDVVNAPAVRLVNSIIKEAVPFRASDIHIEPAEKTVRIRYRIDGLLSDRARFPIESYPAIAARLKIMSGMNIAERRIPQDGRINMSINATEYDFRVSTLPTVHGEKFVIRVLDKSAFNLKREELGFTREANGIVDKMLSKPHGIILMSGPTGCGKSTTLYTFLREVNSPNVNIVTVEDPVEYTMPGINQTQVNNKANMTFATALRSIMRQDPDIIMIGEIRDEETAQIAIRAAITGHLVFSTIHTNDAPGVLTRLTDMGVSNYLVADALIGVISQRLVKRLCPACKKRSKTSKRETAMLGFREPVSVYRPKGCQFCNNTGYRGRIAVHEIMHLNENIRNAMTQNITAEKLREVVKTNGMIPLWENCRNYVLNGITSIQELMALYME